MQGVVAQHGMDLVDAAHLFAMGEIVTTDAGIACFDSKFFYQFWRPITAIRNADKDGNPDTTADPAWQALLGVPGHPEYPSQHGCFTAGFSDALAAALHTKHLDVTMPGGQNGSSVLTTTQHFNNVDDIQDQVVDARVWLGFHFRNSVEQGEKIGNDVAKWELKRFFKPVHCNPRLIECEWPASVRATRALRERSVELPHGRAGAREPVARARLSPFGAGCRDRSPS